MKLMKKTVFIVLSVVFCGFIVCAVFFWGIHKDSKKDTFLEMVYVEGGAFTMGPSSEEDRGYDIEYPPHQVMLSSFYISKYQITVAQFARFVQETGYLTEAERGSGNIRKQRFYGSWIERDGNDIIDPTINWRFDGFGKLRDSTSFNYPVLHVTWYDTDVFCMWLSKKEGKTYRLPTEAEWEYAARGGIKDSPTIYSGSNNLDEVGWYISNSQGTPHEVGLKKPNELGIYDMSGNIMEWCADWLSHYSPDTQTNPQGPDMELSNESEKVVRGGSWARFESDCRVANRTGFSPLNRGGGLGFRVVYSAEEQ